MAPVLLEAEKLIPERLRNRDRWQSLTIDYQPRTLNTDELNFMLDRFSKVCAAPDMAIN